MSLLSNYRISDYIIWKLVSIWLLVDSITGFFMSYGVTLPISQLFKLGILFVVIARLVSYKYFFRGLFLVILYIIIYLNHIAINGYEASYAILTLSKFLSLLCMYVYFVFSFKTNPFYSIQGSTNAVKWGWTVFFSNIILGLLGYGIPTYGDLDKGVKGFFFAGNELGGILAVMAPLLFYISLKKFSGLKTFLSYLFIIAIGIIIGTKTAILAVLLSALVIPWLYMSRRNRIMISLAIGVLVAMLIPVLTDFFASSTIGTIERWQFFYSKGGLSTLIFSGRDDYWETNSEAFFKSSLTTLLFGMGSNGKIVERDHLDAILMYGYVGGGIIITFFVYLLLKSIVLSRNNPFGKVVIFSNILVLCIGYIAGHVWFSAMASVYIALINSMLYIKPPFRHNFLINKSAGKI